MIRTAGTALIVFGVVILLVLMSNMITDAWVMS